MTIYVAQCYCNWLEQSSLLSIIFFSIFVFFFLFYELTGKNQEDEDKAEAFLLKQMEFAEASSSGAKGNKTIASPLVVSTGSISSPRGVSSAHKNRAPVTEDSAIKVKDTAMQNQSTTSMQEGGLMDRHSDSMDLDARRLALEAEMRQQLEVEQEVNRKKLEAEQEATRMELETTRKELEAERDRNLKELEAERDAARKLMKAEQEANQQRIQAAKEDKARELDIETEQRTKRLEEEEIERRRKLDDLERDLQEKIKAQQAQLKLIEEAKEDKVSASTSA